VLSACLCAIAVNCGSNSADEPDPPSGPGLHVLFVGNSLTYVNDLPGILEALADAGGHPRLETRTVAFPDHSLEDHWGNGQAVRQIEAGGWHFVVLQQGPSSVEANRQNLIEYAQRFAGKIRQAGGRPALYMVWPSAGRRGDFERASESYRLAAEATDGLLFAVGDAWRAAWNRDPQLALYAPDGLHPSVAGSYLAALVMYAVLYEATPVGLPAQLTLRDGTALGVPQQVADLLQAAAAETTRKVKSAK
jgi:hypothetical protein